MSDAIPVRKAQPGSSTRSARERQGLFVEHYLTNGQNGTQAAIAAGYGPKGARTRANGLLKEPDIQDLIASRATEVAEVAQLNTECWARDLAAITFSNIGDLYDEKGKLRSIDALPEQAKRAIASVKLDKDGRITEVKFWDKNVALATVARHLGLFERDNQQRAPDLQLVVNLV